MTLTTFALTIGLISKIFLHLELFYIVLTFLLLTNLNLVLISFHFSKLHNNLTIPV